MNLKVEQLHSSPKEDIGLSSKEKKKLRQGMRNQRIKNTKEKSREGQNYGDIKVSRRIPEAIIRTVQERDKGRDFGRPGHMCAYQGPPHHIIHFEQFLNGEVTGSPHTVENLESPCSECHKLAHEMGIPSGISIETFFREKFNNPD